VDSQPLINSYQTPKKELDMKKSNPENTIKLIILNPLTKAKADERTKSLIEYLSEIWRKKENIK